MSSPPTQTPSGLSRWSDRTLILLLILCVVLPYANTLPNSFVHDDVYQVLRNPYVRSVRYLPEIFTTSVWSFAGGPSNYYRPMMTLGYLFCYKLFGFSPYGFHLANIVLHAAVVCFLFFLTVRLFRDRALAFLAAVIFALHPIHSEPVAWIAAVTDLELTFFYLLTFWFFLEVARAEGRTAVLVQLAMAGSFGLALLSKEQAVTLPFLATVYEHFYREDRAETTRGQKFSRYGVLWLLAIAYVPVRIHFLGGFAPELKFPDLTRYQAFLSVLALVGQYLWKLLWPVRLCAYYVFHKSVTLLDPRVLGGLAGLIVCAVLFLLLWRRARPASFALIWLLATLAPVLNPQWVGLNVFTERYLYLPSVGFCWVAAWGLERLWATASSRRPVWRCGFVAVAGVLTVLCMFRIVTRNGDWRNNVVFYTRVLAASPDADAIRNELGATYKEQGDLQAAEREFCDVLQHDPNNLGCLNNLASVFIDQRRYVEAIEILLRTIQLDPRYAYSHMNLGLAYTRMGLTKRAEEELRTGIALAPKESAGYVALGILYWQTGNRNLAEAALKRALSISPSNSGFHLTLGEFYAANGRITDAIQEYRATLETDPDNARAISALRASEGASGGSRR